jgi:hypothetical protein
MILSACVAFDDEPETYVQALKPDLYYVVGLTYPSSAVSVMFRTAKPRGQTLPVNVRLLAWANEGGNIYDGSLGDTTLDSPAEGERLLTWTGAAVVPEGLMPGAATADKIGVELRTFLPVVAYEPAPQTGGYAEVEFMGAGITATGSWIDALLQLWVKCLGDVGQLVACHSLHYVVAPWIFVQGVAPTQGVDDVSEHAPKSFHYLMFPEVLIFNEGTAWWFQDIRELYGRPGMRELLKEHPRFGPFETPEDVARAASEQLGLRYGDFLSTMTMVGEDGPDNPSRRVVEALLELSAKPGETP